MKVSGDDWNILLEPHWNTCKFFLVSCHKPCLQTDCTQVGVFIGCIGNSSLNCFQLLQNSDLFATSRVKAYFVRRQMHCSQRSSSWSPVLHHVFFLLKMGVTQNLQNCPFLLEKAMFWTMPLNELPNFVPASCHHQKHKWVWAGQAWSTNEPTILVCCWIHSFSEGWSFWATTKWCSIKSFRTMFGIRSSMVYTTKRNVRTASVFFFFFEPASPARL